MTVQVALLRGMNVGGRTLPIAELRAAMTDDGFVRVRSYIASGNLLFEGAGGDTEVAARLVALIEARFDLACPVIVRDGNALDAINAANPMPDATAARPKQVQLMLAQRPIAAEVAQALAGHARDGEVVAVAGGALWIDYTGGIARSKLTARLIDGLAGGTVTGRNWSTIGALRELARA